MRDLEAIKAESVFGKLLRLPLRLVPSTAVVPVLTGPARGLKWVVGAGTHGNWIGSYELDQQRLLARRFHECGTTCVFYDIGANVGFYSLLAAKLMPNGHVLAFEPFDRNIGFLNRHVGLNGTSNIEVKKMAIGAYNGTTHFKAGAHHATGYVASDGEIEVAIRSIDHLIAEEALPLPQVIKIDVEGAELAVLTGMSLTLRDVRPALFISTHSEQLQQQCVDLLTSHGYQTDSKTHHGLIIGENCSNSS